MKFMLLVHHDEVAFDQIVTDKQQQMLAESVALTHQLHANGQYLSASPLQPAATAVIVRYAKASPSSPTGHSSRPANRSPATF